MKQLWLGGIDGCTAGILCGSLSMLMRWLFTEPLTYIVLIVAGIFTLLGDMQITIPSLIRAVQNRPRADWEEEEEELRQEPAALVVNHMPPSGSSILKTSAASRRSGPPWWISPWTENRKSSPISAN